jgi:putative ABC transport system permease protein
MSRFLLASLRQHVGRLAAAGIAIAISTAFIGAAITSVGAIQDTVRASFAARFGQADFVAQRPVWPNSPWAEALPDGAEEAIAAIPGVGAAHGLTSVFVTVRAGQRAALVGVEEAPEDARFASRELADGAAPAAPGQIALDLGLAQRLRLGIGDRVELTWQTTSQAAPGLLEAQVSGLLEDSAPDLGSDRPAGILSPRDARLIATQTGARPDAVAVALAPEADRDAAAAAIAQALNALPAQDEPSGATPARVEPPAAIADRFVATYLGSSAILATLVLAFAAVALIVACLVISNTFQVLIAQRTRDLALLRCVGATRGQLRRLVLAEALATGLAASAVGVAVGAGLAQAALATARAAFPALPLPDAAAVSPWAVGLPLGAGTAATLAAALLPARLATRVPPLAALRPAAAPDPRRRAGRLRLAAALAGTFGGAAILALAIALSGSENAGSRLLGLVGLGILGATACLVGIILGGVFWIPPAVRWAASLVGRAGPSAKIAATNSRRNPRRTAATTSALIIGVALFATVSTGAASVERTLGAILDQRVPIDLTVGTATSCAGPKDDAGASAGNSPCVLENLPPESLFDSIRSVDGVLGVAVIRVAALAVRAPGGTEASMPVSGIEPAAARATTRGDFIAGPLEAGEAVVALHLAEANGWDAGDIITVTGPLGSRELPARPTDELGEAGDAAQFLIPQDVLDAVTADARPASAFVGFDPNGDAAAAAREVLDIASTAVDSSGAPVDAAGQILRRSSAERAIGTLLAIVSALLAVSVLIALVGVANTLSLSVIERRCESALLRALGLTRRQMRGMLAIEGGLVSGVGALLGTLIGVAFGWAGATLLFSASRATALAVAPGQLAAALGIAVAAGLLASVLPGRRAANTPPAAALAME